MEKGPTGLTVRYRWERFCDALEQKGARRTLGAFKPGLRPEEVADIMDDLLIPEHPKGDVPELFACVNGGRGGKQLEIFPGLYLLSLTDMVKTRQTLLAAQRLSQYGYPPFAGWPSFQFIPEFVPFAEGDRHVLVSDLRGGEHHGQVLKYDKDFFADVACATWVDLGSCLDGLTQAIVTRTHFEHSTPSVIDGELIWTR